jgi:F-type H+-transporting ATPase subunit b
MLLSSAPILDIDATLFLYLGVFLLLFLILRAMVFRPVMELFDERERAIDGARVEARQREREAEDKLTSFEQEMNKVRGEAGTERDRLRAEGVRLERMLTEKVRGETETTVREAEALMANEAAKLRRDIAESSPQLARQIAEKLLGREVGP